MVAALLAFYFASLDTHSGNPTNFRNGEAGNLMDKLCWFDLSLSLSPQRGGATLPGALFKAARQPPPKGPVTLHVLCSLCFGFVQEGPPGGWGCALEEGVHLTMQDAA